MQQIRQMIADVDKDGSGAIDYDEFEYMMTAKIGERDTREELLKAFRILDHDKNVKSPSPVFPICLQICEISFLLITDFSLFPLFFAIGEDI